jgi:hypothetical protein
VINMFKLGAYFARRAPSSRETEITGHIAIAQAYTADIGQVYGRVPPGTPTFVPVRTWRVDDHGNIAQTGVQNVGPMTHEQAWATQHGLDDYILTLQTQRNAEEWRRKHG